MRLENVQHARLRHDRHRRGQVRREPVPGECPGGPASWGFTRATADRLLISRSRLDGNNFEKFNSAPVSGGIKVGRSRDRHRDQQLDLEEPWPGLLVRRVGLRHPHPELQHRRQPGRRVSSSRSRPGAPWPTTSSATTAATASRSTTRAPSTIYNNTVVRNGRALNLVQDPEASREHVLRRRPPLPQRPRDDLAARPGHRAQQRHRVAHLVGATACCASRTTATSAPRRRWA